MKGAAGVNGATGMTSVTGGDHPTGADGVDGVDGEELRARMARDLERVNAPDVVLAVTRRGRRFVVSGGSAARQAGRRENLRYALGSLSKTYTVLLLAELAGSGALALDDPVAAHLPRLPLTHPYARRITLRHLATHTSGLPRVPRDLMAAALLRPSANGYAGYGTERLLHAFARAAPRHAPGSRWRYSNFGMALLGAALAHTAGTGYGTLLAGRVLGPLRLHDSGTAPGCGDAIGHRPDGRTPLPPPETAAFAPAGAVRATPADLLGYVEAHLDPGASALAGALRRVQVPQLRRGRDHHETHTLTWYQHPAPGGPLLFHAGATFGQQAFAGFHPASGTGVAATATRHDRACRIVGTAYALLYDLAGA